MGREVLTQSGRLTSCQVTVLEPIKDGLNREGSKLCNHVTVDSADKKSEWGSLLDREGKEAERKQGHKQMRES